MSSCFVFRGSLVQSDRDWMVWIKIFRRFLNRRMAPRYEGWVLSPVFCGY